MRAWLIRSPSGRAEVTGEKREEQNKFQKQDGMVEPNEGKLFDLYTVKKTRVRVFLCIPDEGFKLFEVVQFRGWGKRLQRWFHGWLTNSLVSRDYFNPVQVIPWQFTAFRESQIVSTNISNQVGFAPTTLLHLSSHRHHSRHTSRNVFTEHHQGFQRQTSNRKRLEEESSVL